MKICPKCENPHEKKGTFCSRTCANSRVFSEESKEKKRLSGIAAYESLNEQDKANRLKTLNEATNNPASIVKRKATWVEKYEVADFKDLSWEKKRDRILKDQGYRCGRCGITEWLSEKIPLEVDHVDGVNSNDDRSNLIALCPNCHSLTSTWRGRNIANKNVTDENLKVALDASPNIRQALILVGLSPRGKNYQRANRLLEK